MRVQQARTSSGQYRVVLRRTSSNADTLCRSISYFRDNACDKVGLPELHSTNSDTLCQLINHRPNKISKIFAGCCQLFWSNSHQKR